MPQPGKLVGSGTFEADSNRDRRNYIQTSNNDALNLRKRPIIICNTLKANN